MKNSLLVLSGILLCAFSAKSQTEFITIPNGTIPNEVPGSPGPYTLGQRFTVNNGGGIYVTSLGAYDDNDPNSFASAQLPVQVGIFAVSGPNAGNLVTPVATFTGAGSGTAVGDVLYQAIYPSYLAPGDYVLAASGYSGLGQGYEVFGNTAHPPYQGGGFWTFNDGGGQLSLGGSGNTPGAGFTYPLTVSDNSGAQPQYAAGDFQYESAVPEASNTAMLLIAASSICILFNRR